MHLILFYGILDTCQNNFESFLATNFSNSVFGGRIQALPIKNKTEAQSTLAIFESIECEKSIQLVSTLSEQKAEIQSEFCLKYASISEHISNCSTYLPSTFGVFFAALETFETALCANLQKIISQLQKVKNKREYLLDVKFLPEKLDENLNDPKLYLKKMQEEKKQTALFTKYAEDKVLQLHSTLQEKGELEAIPCFVKTNALKVTPKPLEAILSMSVALSNEENLRFIETEKLRAFFGDSIQIRGPLPLFSFFPKNEATL